MTASFQKQNDPRTPLTPSAVAEREAYAKASAVALAIAEELPTLPRSSAVTGDLIGFYVRLNFGTNEPDGVLEFAAYVGVEVEASAVGTRPGGMWLEARGVVEGVPVRAEVLLSDEAAAAFVTSTARPLPSPDDETPDADTMALAEVPAAAGGAQ